ncbi:flavodoxin family protein [Oceanicoccus sagamiensis]|uniref:Flavodoxin n=1 Tax=Oceanicoccus sagamiensis TaxID=716816 RepID=A0A1X9ND30_9GAMM|nr:NAD(P)H-dependent oxidoreductase [Oceanicoccus sagamiensis]ARN75940.1 flavodoxin [Oceanicoccus sagamiensis]
MKHLLIIYHSQSGTTRALAEAVLRGAVTEPLIEPRLVPAMEAGVEELLWADALVFATPENFGYISGGLKDFFDRTYYAVASRQINLPYAVIISAGNDGTGALRQLQRIAKGYPLRCVTEPVILVGELSTEGLAASEELGAAIAAGLGMGIY